jgi:hypothetical protein
MTETNIAPHLDNDVSAEFTEVTLSTDDTPPNLIPLAQFIQDFGEGLRPPWPPRTHPSMTVQRTRLGRR